METMKAVVFTGTDHISLEQVPKPHPRAGEAVIRITTTTICGTDVNHQRDRALKVGLYPWGVPSERVAALAEAHAVDDQC